MTAPLSDEQIAEMLDDCDNASAASLHAVCRHYVRALAAEVKRYRTEVARIADEFAEMKAELEATQAYGDEQRNRRKMAELQVEAIANEAANLRSDLAAAKATIATLTEERDESRAQIETLVRDGLDAYEKISMLTIEEQKWRDSFFTAIAKRDTMRLALSAVAGDPCDEPYMDGHAPCGCCRAHIKTARRALDE